MSARVETLPIAQKPETPFRRLVADFFANPVAAASLALLLLIVFLAVLAPWLAPQNAYDLATVTVMDARLAPGERGSAGFVMWLGADGAGRDMWSAILYIPAAGCYALDASWPGGSWRVTFAAGL